MPLELLLLKEFSYIPNSNLLSCRLLLGLPLLRFAFVVWAILAILPQDARSVISLCTEYIFIELATTFALVVCFLTALCAGGAFRNNQSQIVSVRYSFVISAGVANIVRTVIVSRFVLFCRGNENIRASGL